MKVIRLTILSVALLAAVAGCGGKPPDPAPEARSAVIFAASSLKELVTDLAGQWSAKTKRPYKLQFEATSTLARQIQEGAPADVFVTAAPEWLDKLNTLERFDWLSNRLVVVVLKDEKDFDLKGLESLALANEQVPVGKYAREALAHEGIKIPERTIYGQNVRDVLSKVSQGGAKAGIIYATDVSVDPNVRVAYTFPPESHSKILYSVGVLTPDGKEFANALKESWALDVARKYGFADMK